MENRSTTPVLILSGLVFVVSITAYVVLELYGGDTGGVLTLAGPILAALFVTGTLGREQARIHEKVERVEKQTNGVLDARIREQTAAAIREVLPMASAHQAVTAADVDHTDPPAGPTPAAPSTSTMDGFDLGTGGK